MPELLHPDIQQVLAEILTPFVAAGRTGPAAPADLQTKLPFIRAYRAGGPTDRLDDTPIVQVDVFAGSYAVGMPLARRVQAFLLAKPPPHWSIDTVSCPSGPSELAWDDDDVVRRFGATYAMTTRRSVPT